MEFIPSQVYVVFFLAMGGEDLEHCALRSYDEARSVLLQVSVGYATATGHSRRHAAGQLVHTVSLECPSLSAAS